MQAEEPGVSKARGRGHGLAVLLAAAVLLSAFSWRRDLFDADEGRYASVAVAMVESGDWVTPRLNGLPFMDKPPLVYWVQAALLRAAPGRPEWAARATTLLAGSFWVLFVFLLARGWTGSLRKAWFAALLAATSAAGMAASRIGPQMDMPLAAAVAGAVYALWRGNAVLLGLSVGLGLLSKGPLVAVVPGLAALSWTLLGATAKPYLKTAFHPVAWLVALAIAAPWYLLAEKANPGWIRHFLLYEHWGRFSEPDYRDWHPLWYYVPVALAYLAPWTLLSWAGPPSPSLSYWLRFPASILTWSPWSPVPWTATLDRPAAPGRRGGQVAAGRLAFGWFLAAFVLYSVSTRKLPNYLLPAAAPLFVLVGARLEGLFARRSLRPLLGPAIFGGAMIATAEYVRAHGWPFAGADHPTGPWVTFDTRVWSPALDYGLAAGILLLLAVVLAALSRRPVRRAMVLVAGAAVAWWCLDLGAAEVGYMRSARRLAVDFRAVLRPGDVAVAYRRYPQGLGFYGGPRVWIAGGDAPGKWTQREIVEPYATRAWQARPFSRRSAAEREQGGLLTDAEFEGLWTSRTRVVMVCRPREALELKARILSGYYAGTNRTDLVLATNDGAALR